MTTIETSRIAFYPTDDESKLNQPIVSFDVEDAEDTEEGEIPYHAREYAQPFTYGSLPKGFKKSDLNHVPIDDLPDNRLDIEEVTESESTNTASPSPVTDISFEELPHPSNYVNRSPFVFQQAVRTEDVPESSRSKRPPAMLPPTSPSTTRRTARPSISPSRPVLRKTPSRQEFEEMLRERQEQSMREQNHALKEAQNAAIQKDLDALQEKLQKRALLLQSTGFTKAQVHSPVIENPCREIVRHVESIDLPDENSMNFNKTNKAASSVTETTVSKYEPAVAIADNKRPETPAFPERCTSPYPMGSPILPRKNSLSSKNREKKSPLKLPALPAIAMNAERPKNASADPLSNSASEIPHDVAPHLVKFARDSSAYWYKPQITREEAIAMLRNAVPGTFIIRNSTTYKNAFGLVLRVSKPPQNLNVPDPSGDILVRHFLLEPTTRGVRLKGCSNEPTFTSLSALVYQHSINQLALPCKLIIPSRDLLLSPEDEDLVLRQKHLLEQGAACNVLYLFSMDTESLTGDEAIRKTVYEMYAQTPLITSLEVHFKVSQNGITLTDNKRRKFFRKHYAPNNVSHIAMDPDGRFYSVFAVDEGFERTVNKSIFGFVAREPMGKRDNQCHIFCDLAVTQPATAIVSFAHKVLPLHKNYQQIL